MGRGRAPRRRRQSGRRARRSRRRWRSGTPPPRRCSATAEGSVEGQRAAGPAVDRRALNAVLIEEEKVRTLSRSTAQITFRDDSRLRLNANSQAVIQRMRVDPLEPRGGGQGQPGRGRLLRAARRQEPAQELRARGARGPDRDRIRPTSGSAATTTGSKFANYDERALAGLGAGREREPRPQRGARWCAAARRRARRSTSCRRRDAQPRPRTTRSRSTPRSS